MNQIGQYNKGQDRDSHNISKFLSAKEYQREPNRTPCGKLTYKPDR